MRDQNPDSVQIMQKIRVTFGLWTAILSASLLLHGCASNTTPPPTKTSKPARKPAQNPPKKPNMPPLLRPSSALIAPKIQILQGLESVLGATITDLTKQFGPPRLDITEGDARKLQFTGTACILDIYLYPPAAGKAPLASYIAARRSDGRDVDRVACVLALRKK